MAFLHIVSVAKKGNVWEVSRVPLIGKKRKNVFPLLPYFKWTKEIVQKPNGLGFWWIRRLSAEGKFHSFSHLKLTYSVWSLCRLHRPLKLQGIVSVGGMLTTASDGSRPGEINYSPPPTSSMLRGLELVYAHLFQKTIENVFRQARRQAARMACRWSCIWFDWHGRQQAWLDT